MVRRCWLPHKAAGAAPLTQGTALPSAGCLASYPPSTGHSIRLAVGRQRSACSCKLTARLKTEDSSRQAHRCSPTSISTYKQGSLLEYRPVYAPGGARFPIDSDTEPINPAEPYSKNSNASLPSRQPRRSGALKERFQPGPQLSSLCFRCATRPKSCNS